jgi:serine/threonine protein kinase
MGEAMNTDRAQRAREIFLELSTLDASAVQGEIDRLVGNDRGLRDAVIALLDARAAADADGFMDAPTASIHPGRAAESAGTRVGPYKLLQAIGEGGFGTVFLAEQHAPVRRRAALKIIKLGMDTRLVIARFEAERQALALMDHPHIARVFDAGATETGRPYFAMEYVVGDAITRFADAYRLDIPARLALFGQVCSAVQHAHTKGVIHRDLKPANVLVSLVDGKPFAKVIDFGIAKATASPLTEKTLFTEHRQLIGTPEYMSPEQADGSPDLDTRTDVYALGVLLYELLTGATPFDATRLRSAAWGELQRIIREEDPPAPSLRLSREIGTLAGTAAARGLEPTRLSTAVRGELDWVVMKAIEKDRARRYDTPAQLAEDIARHLRGEPVVAAPPSRMYKAKKFVRRNKGPVIAGSAVAATLLIGIAGTAWGWRTASQVNDVLRRQQHRAEAGVGEMMGILMGHPVGPIAPGVRVDTGEPSTTDPLEYTVGFGLQLAEQLVAERDKLREQADRARRGVGDMLGILSGGAVGGPVDSINPKTGESEFDADPLGASIAFGTQLAESLRTERNALAEQTRRATHDSHISQSLLDQQQGLLASSFDHARAAHEIDPTWTAGMQIDMLAEQSAEQWRLLAHVPGIGVVDAMALAPEGTLVVARLGVLRTFDLEGGASSGEVAIRPGVRRILRIPSRDHLVLVMQEHSLQIVDLAAMRVAATWESDAPLDAVAAGRDRVAATTRDSLAHVLSLDLAVLGSLAWPAEATRRAGYGLHSIAMTADGTKVIFSTMGLSDDRVLWLPDSGDATILTGLWMNQYSFESDGSLIGVANELHTTGFAVTRYLIRDDNSVVHDRVLADIPKENIGSGALASVSGTELIYAGTRGVARIDTNSTRDVRSRVRTARYDSLLLDPDLDPRAPCASADGRSLAFSDGAGVVVFARTTHWSFDYVEGAKPVYTRDALFEIQSNGSVAEVIDISDPSRPGAVFARLRVDDAEPGRHATILGYGVSPDGRVHAIRVVDMPNTSRYASLPTNHRILVYRDVLAGADRPVEPIRIAEPDRESRGVLSQVGGGLLEFSTDGSLLLSRTGSDAKTDTVALYRTSDGTPVGNWPDGPPAGNDITMVRGHDLFLDVPRDEMSCNIRELKTGRVLRTIGVPGRVHAVACGNFAARIAIKSFDDKVRAFNALTGELVAELATPLVPSAWSPNDDVFAAADYPNSARTEQNLVLARAGDAAIVGVLQRSRGRSSSVMFSPDGTGLLHPQAGVSGRIKSFRVSENLSPEEALPRIRRAASHGTRWSPIDRSTVRADQDSRLRKALGTAVELEGTVVRVAPTRSGGHFTLYLDNEDTGVLVFIRSQHAAEFLAQVNQPRIGDLLGQRVKVRGPIQEYGGYSESLRDRLQVTWDESSAVATVTPAER